MTLCFAGLPSPSSSPSFTNYLIILFLSFQLLLLLLFIPMLHWTESLQGCRRFSPVSVVADVLLQVARERKKGNTAVVLSPKSSQQF